MIARILKLSLIVVLLAGCTHSFLDNYSSNKNSLENSSKKKKRKSSTIESPEEPASPDTPSYAEDSALYLRVSDLQTSVAVGDVQSLRRTASVLDRSLLSRASLVYILLRSYLHEGIDAVLIDRAIFLETIPLQVKNWANISSLEDLFQSGSVSLKNEIDSNPFLQNIAVIDLSLRALDQDANKTSTFVTELHTLLTQKSEQWMKVRDRLTATVAPVSTTASAPAANTEPAPAPAAADVSTGAAPVVPTPEATPPPPTPDLASAQKLDAVPESELVKKSSELLEKNKFQEAITLLRSVPETSSSYAEAKSKIRIIANKAVGELRTKAARSYQSAVPMQDLKARSSYLTEAQNYLLKAIEQYPESDQLDAVRQNLNIIQKNLNVINK